MYLIRIFKLLIEKINFHNYLSITFYKLFYRKMMKILKIWQFGMIKQLKILLFYKLIILKKKSYKKKT
jgi:hypothetical protein